MEVLIYAVEYTPKNEPLNIRRYSFTLDEDFEPNEKNVYEVYKFGREKFRMRGRIFTILFGGVTFQIDPGGKYEPKIYRLG